MSDQVSQQPSFWRSRAGIAVIVLGAIALFLMIMEHRAHVLGLLPFLLLLACPATHLFMHRHHHHQGARGGQQGRDGEEVRHDQQR